MQGLPATSSSHVLTAAGLIQFNQQLGHGSFKAVYKGYDEEEGIEVAWCQVNMDRVGEAEKAQIQTEVDILKSLDHKVRHTACQKKGIFPVGRVHLRHRSEGTRGPTEQYSQRCALHRGAISPSQTSVSSPMFCAQHILTFYTYFDLPRTKQIVFVTEIMTSGTLKQ